MDRPRLGEHTPGPSSELARRVPAQLLRPEGGLLEFREGNRAGKSEPAGRFGRCIGSDQLEQRERVAARLADDLVANPRVQRPREYGIEQRAGIVLAQTLVVLTRQPVGS
jgi:hypothetical protein